MLKTEVTLSVKTTNLENNEKWVDVSNSFECTTPSIYGSTKEKREKNRAIIYEHQYQLLVDIIKTLKFSNINIPPKMLFEYIEFEYERRDEIIVWIAEELNSFGIDESPNNSEVNKMLECFKKAALYLQNIDAVYDGKFEIKNMAELTAYAKS